MNSKFSITDIETAFKAVELNGMALQFVLPELCTEALALLAVEKNAHVLKYVPMQYRTEAVLLKALESDVYVLPHIPDIAWSEVIALNVVQNHALDLKKIPDQFRTEAVIHRAVHGNWMALEYVPTKMFSQSLIDSAVASSEKALQYVPPRFRTKEAALRAGVMYQFDYEEFVGDLYPEVPQQKTTCIVPSRWLGMGLPTFGGAVVYTDNPKKDGLSYFVFEFSELEFNELGRTVSLQIYAPEHTSDHEMSVKIEPIFEQPIKVYCRDLVVSDENWCIEIVLVNHFLGTLKAASNWGNCFVDLSDIHQILESSSEFVFEFGIGDTLAEIVPNILDRVSGEPGNVFLMFYCNSQKFRLSLLDEVHEMIDSSFEDATVLIGNAAVKLDKILISVLVGCGH